LQGFEDTSLLLQRRKAYIHPVKFRDSLHDLSSHFHGVLHHDDRIGSGCGAGPPGAGLSG
jgi:hypothetical protein